MQTETTATARKEERNQRIVSLHLEQGLSYREIGDRVGLTGEAVRKVIRRAGVTKEESQKAKAERRRRAKEEEAARKEAERVDKFNQKKEELIDYLKRLATKLGRTPTTQDILDHDGPTHTTFYRYFGSLQKAQELAGLIPNERGGAGHTDAPRPSRRIPVQERPRVRREEIKEARIPSAKEIDAEIHRRISEEEPNLVQRAKQQQSIRNEACSLRKALAEQVKGAASEDLLPLYQAIADAAVREAIAIHEAAYVEKRHSTLFHRKRAEVYREAVAEMRPLAEAGRAAPELQQRADKAAQAKEKLEAILVHVKKGAFLFRAGPLDVFEKNLADVLRLLR